MSGIFDKPWGNGHHALAGHLAGALGATPVLTTASDARQTLAVDLLGRGLGWVVEATHAELVRCSAAVVNDEAVALVQEAGSEDWWTGHANGLSGPLAANIQRLARLEEVPVENFAAVLWVSQRPMPDDFATKLAGKRVIYRP